MTNPRWERERRFIVAERSILRGVSWHLIDQGYLWTMDGYTIRARVQSIPERSGDESVYSATITAKGPRIGDAREEYEMDVDADFARELIHRSEAVIHKRRYQYVTDVTWDIDEFLDDNEGLIIAELEGGAEIEKLKPPSWAFKEITSDTRFNNEMLAHTPVSRWDTMDWKPDSPWDWD
jgi:adenylate cyclase